MTSKTKTPLTKVAKPSDINAVYEVRNRYFFNEDRAILDLPKMIEVQLDSYKKFLDSMMEGALKEVFPIHDFSEEKIEIHFKSYELEEPRYSPQQCRHKNLNYDAALRVKLEMLNKETGEIKEDTVFLGGVPLMTEKATFIINGIERVIVNQIIKSDGLFFEPDHLYRFTAKIKPKKGVWIESIIDKKGIISVRIDKKRKIPATVLLRAFGLDTDAKILAAYKGEKEFIANYLQPTIDKDKTKSRMEALHLIYKLIRPGDLGTDERVEDLFNVTFGDAKRFDLGEVARIKMNRKLNLDHDYKKDGQFLHADDLIAMFHRLMTLVSSNEAIGDDIDRLDNRRIRSVGELVYDKFLVGLARMERIAKDRMTVVDLDEATARTFINHRPVEAVMKEFFASSQLSQFMDQSNPLSELAHKRRISAMGPGGLTRERASFEVRDVHPTQYGRICPIATPEGPNIGLVLHFSTFARVDKYGFIITPYQKIGHTVKNDGKEAINRIALGDIKGAKGKVLVKDKKKITKKDAESIKSEIKDKEITVRGFVTDEYEYVDAHQELGLVIAEANSGLDEHGNFDDTRIGARIQNEATLVYVSDITHKDVSPKQIVSVSTSLVPFVEHDDATRAEMGTNMMRQAVPLVKPNSPIVGTGME